MTKSDIISKLMDLYCCSTAGYAVIVRDKRTKEGWRYITLKDDIVTPRDIRQHLDGVKTISVHGRKMNTSFMTFDIDVDDLEIVRLVRQKLVDFGIPFEKIYISTSGNKGYHIDCFFEHMIFKSDIGNIYSYLMDDPVLAKVGSKIEHFPYRDRVIKIPLGINFKTGRRCWFLDQETLEPIESFDYVGQIEKINKEHFGDQVHEMNKRRKQERYERARQNQEVRRNIIEDSKIVAKEEKPQKKYKAPEQHEPVMTVEGQRHQMMLRKAVWLRCTGSDEEDIFEELLHWVERQNQSLIKSSWREIEDDARLIARDVVKEYSPKVRIQNQDEARKEWAKKITAANLQNIMMGSTQSVRKVALLVCVYTKRFKNCQMGQAKMAEKLGMSSQTVMKALKELREKKVIVRTAKGGLVNVHGEDEFRPDTYVFVELMMSKPMFSVRDVCWYKFSEVKDDIDGFYYKMLHDMLTKAEVKKHLTRAELKRYKELGYDKENAVGG